MGGGGGLLFFVVVFVVVVGVFWGGGGGVININCDLSHKHCAPGRPVWYIQTLEFPEAITISVIRSLKTQICNPRTQTHFKLLQYVEVVVLKAKLQALVYDILPSTTAVFS